MAQDTITNTVNGVDVEVLKQTVGAIQGDPGLGKCVFRGRNTWTQGTRNCTTITDFYGAKQEMAHGRPFELHADEPPILAGDDSAPNPVEHLLNALAGCVTTSLVAHAAVRGIHIEELESELEGDLDLRGFLGLSPNTPKGFTAIRVAFRVKTDPENLRLLEELAAFSPVYNTITQGAAVAITIAPK